MSDPNPALARRSYSTLYGYAENVTMLHPVIVRTIAQAASTSAAAAVFACVSALNAVVMLCSRLGSEGEYNELKLPDTGSTRKGTNQSSEDPKTEPLLSGDSRG